MGYVSKLALGCIDTSSKPWRLALRKHIDYACQREICLKIIIHRDEYMRTFTVLLTGLALGLILSLVAFLFRNDIIKTSKLLNTHIKTQFLIL